MKKLFISIAMLSILALGSAELFAWGGGPARGGGQVWHHGPAYGPMPGFAPQRGGGGAYGIGYLDFLKEEIGVSDDQIHKIIKVDADYRVKYYDSRNDYRKIEELRIEHRKAVEKILTKEQIKKLDEYTNSRMPRRGFGRY